MSKKRSTPVEPVGTLPGEICVPESLATLNDAALELYNAMEKGKVSKAEEDAKLKEIRAAEMIKAELDRERAAIQAVRKLVKHARRS
jgi:hypothetical protein